MQKLTEDIQVFLTANGFDCMIQSVCGNDVIYVSSKWVCKRIILPVSISASSPDEAEKQSSDMLELTKKVAEETCILPLMITEDRWRSQREMMEARLLAHLEIFFPVYARNCEIRKIDKNVAAEFLETNHSYGDAVCRYRYGMFLRRHTGWRSFAGAQDDRKGLDPGTLIAVAEFSNARKWIKGDKIVKSYEWTRYASLPGIRINGGMGKMLKHFIKEVRPDDIMSYADLEWSQGAVYEQLGFVLEGQKEAVSFIVDCNTWKRAAIRAEAQDDRNDDHEEGIRYFRNFGSNKYRLKLTDYR